jgi:hypothetical protein
MALPPARFAQGTRRLCSCSAGLALPTQVSQGDKRMLITMTAIAPLAVSSGGYVGFGILYLVLLIVLGLTAIKKGHWIMFLIGIFIPLFWLIGALLPPTGRSE